MTIQAVSREPPRRRLFSLRRIMPTVGRKPPKQNHTQSVLFYKDNGWDEAKAKKWLGSHDYYSDGLDETDNMLRFRQYDPSENFRYVTKVIESKDDKPSIALVLAMMKRSVDQEASVKTDAISMPNIYSLVASKLQEQMNSDGTWRALIDVYLDGSSMYVVTGVNGLLYKSALTLSGGSIALGDPQLVEVDYKPINQSNNLRVIRQADGKYRWFAFPASTAVLNRSGELDSRELFQNFVRRIDEGLAPYPYLSFYHVGEKLVLGQADFAKVEDYTYLLSGIFADDALSQAARRAIENNPNYYGTSIGYIYVPDMVERVTVSEGITIPVYKDGINHEVSILAEKDAACLYTGIFVQKEGVNRMNKKTLDELEKLAGEDPEAKKMVDALAEKVDAINTDITEKNLVRREQEATTETDQTPAQEEAPAEKPEDTPAPEPQEIVMDEAAMNALAERVAGAVAPLYDEKINTLAADTSKQLEALSSQLKAITDRIAKLEEPLEKQVSQAIQDMPRSTARLIYRPTERQAAQPESTDQVSLEDIAQDTLANLH